MIIIYLRLYFNNRGHPSLSAEKGVTDICGAFFNFRIPKILNLNLSASREDWKSVYIPEAQPQLPLVRQLNQIQDLLRVLNNNDACNAFEAVLNGDERKYLSLYNKLRRDFGWELGLVADQEFLDKIRRVLSDVQESRAKILASYIDDVMTSGGFYRIQTVMDDCKNDILRLQKEYPEYIQGDLD